MRMILIPTDFSGNSFSAAKYAGAFAGKRSWQLLLCHAYLPFYSGFQSAEENGKYEERAVKTVEHKMVLFVKKLQKLFPELSIQGICVKGHLGQIVKDMAEKNSVSLIVMGTLGASGLKMRLIGSNTFAVIQRSDIPVLAVPKRLKEFRLHKVGFATNYLAAEIVALQDLIDMMGDSIDIVAFHFCREGSSPQEEKMMAWKSKTEKMIAHRPLKHTVALTRNFVSGIRQFISKEKLDMLVMTRIDKDLLTRLLGRSLIKAIVHHPPIPLLFIKEK